MNKAGIQKIRIIKKIDSRTGGNDKSHVDKENHTLLGY